MRQILMICLIGLILLPMKSRAQESEFTELPYFSVMPSYETWGEEDKEFDEYKFCDGKKLVSVEGKLWKRDYGLKNDGKEASGLQIIRNYSTAIRNMGGIILIEGVKEGNEKVCKSDAGYARMVTGKITRGGHELWVQVGYVEYNGTYEITMVEKELMKQDVTAGGMLDALNQQGYVALYINFDTGKSTIKPESQQIVAQIVELVKSNPDLKLSIEGHTDNVGSPKSNQTLSEERAKAVVAAITAQGIAGERLSSVGHGQNKPIADNNTEEGRAKNRRVELVKK